MPKTLELCDAKVKDLLRQSETMGVAAGRNDLGNNMSHQESNIRVNLTQGSRSGGSGSIYGGIS